MEWIEIVLNFWQIKKWLLLEPSGAMIAALPGFLAGILSGTGILGMAAGNKFAADQEAAKSRALQAQEDPLINPRNFEHTLVQRAIQGGGIAQNAFQQALAAQQQQFGMQSERNLANQLALAQANQGANPLAALRSAQQAAAQQNLQLGQEQRLAALQAQQQATGLQLQERGQDVQSALSVLQGNKQAPKKDDTADILQGLGGLAAGGAKIFAASDEKLKKSVKPASKDINAFLEALNSKEFKYKDSKNGKGERVGVMAQDMEKSKIGKMLVKDTPDGKMIDMANGFGAVLAAQAELNKRLKAIEKKKG